MKILFKCSINSLDVYKPYILFRSVLNIAVLPSPSENLFIDMADRLYEDGWKELGYVYVNIDDCWSSMDRDKDGRLQADPKRYSLDTFRQERSFVKTTLSYPGQ